MKRTRMILSVAVSVVLLTAVGCKKEDTTEIDRLQEKADELRVAAQKAHEQLAEAIDDRDDLAEDLAIARKDKATLYEALTALTVANRDLPEQLDEAKDRIAELKAQSLAAETEATDLRRQLIESTKADHETILKLREAEALVDMLTIDIANANLAQQAMDDDFRQAKAMAEALRAELTRRESRINVILAENDELRAQVIQLQDAIKVLENADRSAE
jgi:chromosome segregation ATPase